MNNTTQRTYRYNEDRFEYREESESASGRYTDYYRQAVSAPNTSEGRYMGYYNSDPNANW